jgi:IclR family pca regulon transcriptional regulator
MTDKPEHDRDHVTSLARGIAVLEALAGHPRGLTLSETAARTGLSRAGARRFLLTLQALGYVRSQDRRFAATARIVSLANRVSRGLPFHAVAEPAMRGLSAEFGESCSAAVLDGTEIVYVARVPGRRIMTVALEVGSRLPAWCTSMGRVLLAALPDDELDRRLAAIRTIRFTPSTITDRDELRRAILKVRAQGFAVSDEELEQGLRSIAVPVRDGEGHTVAAMNVATVPDRFAVAEMTARILPALRLAAGEIEAQLGS